MPLSRRRALAALCLSAAALAIPGPAPAAEREVIDARVNLALEELYSDVPGARDLAREAAGILVMPKVVKGGFIVGGAYGEGALRVRTGDGYTGNVAYYSVAAASLGLQAGVQETSHVLFFMTPKALERFRNASGWEAGVDAEITVLEQGANIGVDTTSHANPIVAIVFGADGLLLGASLEGSKYSRIAR